MNRAVEWALILICAGALLLSCFGVPDERSSDEYGRAMAERYKR